MLRQRVITGLVLALVFVAAILVLPMQWLAGVFLLLVLLASLEWAQLSGFRHVTARSAYALMIGLLAIAVSFYTGLFATEPARAQQQEILYLGCLWWAVALLWVKTYPASALLWGYRWLRLVIGILVLVPAWLGLVVLRQQADGVALLFILVALVATADIGAYFSGRRWGRAKLAPKVSPGKSWAGFWGGLVCSCSLMAALWWFWGQERFALSAVLAVSLITALASVLGDLVESMVKRHQGVKDSGTLLPGHGGVMDRIDSLSAAAPVFALSILLLGG